MNTELNAPNIVFVTVKVMKATQTKGTRMKVKVIGFNSKAKVYGYHDVTGYQQAALMYVEGMFPEWVGPKQVNWQPNGRDSVMVVLVY